MKKTIIIIACVAMILSSCGTNAGTGAYVGASMGGMLGSAIGGITGGWRGSNVGTLVGVATGAALGAAAGAAVDEQQERAAARRAERANYKSSRDQGYYVGTDRYSNVRERIRNRGAQNHRVRTDTQRNYSNNSNESVPANNDAYNVGTSNPGFHFEKVQDPSGFKKEGGYDDKIDMD